MKDNIFKFVKKGFKTNQTHYYTGGFFNANSGIKVCIFGANSGMANNIIKNLLSRGTPVNLVHRNIYDAEIPIGEKKLFKASNPYKKGVGYFSNYQIPDMAFHQIRTYGEVGYRMFTYCPDLMNEYEMENAIKDCDVVINCIGNNPVLRHMEDYEEANVLIPRQLAKICSRLKNNPVKRLIHFSANNVDPDSESKRLRTKWLGEKEVLEYFPEATIIRPTEIIHNKLDSCFIGYFLSATKNGNNHVMLVDGGKAKKQPVVDNDIALALNRILQIEESKGQIYELGGSHIYTFKELMEFMGNNLNRRPFYLDYSYDDFMKLYLSPNTNWEKAANWVRIRPDALVQMRKDNILVKKKGVKTFEDLNIMPLATHHSISDLCNWLIQKVTIENYDQRSIAELEGHDD